MAVYDKNGKVIKSAYYESDNNEWKSILTTLEEFQGKLEQLMVSDITDDVEAKRFAQDCFDGVDTWISNCKRKGHLIQSSVVKSSNEITSNKEPADKDMADQLAGFIESNEQLYNQMIVPVIKNLSRKVQKGIFDKEKSLILWQNVADEGAKMYVQEQGGPSYNVATRKETAKMLSEYYDEEVMGDNPIESSKQIKSGFDIYKGAKFKNEKGTVIEIVRKDDDGYVLFETSLDEFPKDTTEESMKKILEHNQYTPIE